MSQEMNEESKSDDSADAAGGKPLIDGPLQIDEESLAEAADERGILTDISDELKLWAKKNQLRLLITRADLSKDLEETLASTTFRLVGMPDPACVFVWASLSVDLSLTPNAAFLEIKPESEDSQKITVTKSIEPALKGSISKASLEATLGGKKETQYEIMRPQLTGVNMEDRAIWTFSAPIAESDLRINHHLALKTRYQTGVGPLRAALILRARVAFRGFAGTIPLVGKRNADAGFVAYLDRMA